MIEPFTTKLTTNEIANRIARALPHIYRRQPDGRVGSHLFDCARWLIGYRSTKRRDLSAVEAFIWEKARAEDFMHSVDRMAHADAFVALLDAEHETKPSAPVPTRAR